MTSMVAVLLAVQLGLFGHERLRLTTTSHFRLQFISDSVWGHCELTLSTSGSRDVTSKTACGKPLVRRTRTLDAPEASHIRALVAAANVFEGPSWGRDDRVFDASYETLEVRGDSAVVLLVTSGNPSFERGSRRLLLEALHRIMERTSEGGRRRVPGKTP